MDPALYIGHHYHTVEGLTVTAASTGLQMGPYKNTGAEVLGLVARENHVYGNGIGIKFTNVREWHRNAQRDSRQWQRRHRYTPGNHATIFNNLLYGNGTNLTGENGITFASGK